MKLLRFTAPLTAAAADTKRQTALTVESRAGESGFAVRVRVFSDYSAEPLTLAASDLPEGASLALLLLPWRIELWADGWLRDEEWPCGTLFLTDVPDEAWAAAGITADSAPDNHDRANLTLRAPDFKTDCGISANDAPERIIGQLLSQNGENPAEGWKPSDPGVFAGDCMPYTDTDPDGVERYHVLYLKDRRHHRSKWHKGAHQWAHMSTRDLKNWDLHPLAVSVDDPAEGSICTGSWLRTADGTHYLYYTVRQIDASPAPILRSVSEDGYAFRRDPEFRIELSDRYHGPSARDPKIVRSKDRAEDGADLCLAGRGSAGVLGLLRAERLVLSHFQPPRARAVPDLPQALLGLADAGEPGHSLRERAEDGPLERADPLHGLPSDRGLRGDSDLHGGPAGSGRTAQVLSRSGNTIAILRIRCTP